MGVSPKLSTTDTTPNPNPKNYEILKTESINGNLVIMIKYNDCTNFEGKKILVYRKTRLLELILDRYIDPHFEENKSLIARFIPTYDGWNMALGLARGLL